MPTSPDMLVVVRLRCGAVSQPVRADARFWGFNREGFGPDAPGDIVRWRYANVKDDPGMAEEISDAA